MAYKRTELVWDVPLESVQIGIKIGYEVEFAQNSNFSTILYTLNTYNEITASPQGTFYYSLDGVTWIDFPIRISWPRFS